MLLQAQLNKLPWCLFHGFSDVSRSTDHVRSVSVGVHVMVVMICEFDHTIMASSNMFSPLKARADEASVETTKKETQP